MPISFACPCGKSLVAKDAFAGKRMKCPKCSNIIYIPGDRATNPDVKLETPIVRRVRPSTVELPRPEIPLPKPGARAPEIPTMRVPTAPQVSLPPRLAKKSQPQAAAPHPWIDQSMTPTATPWRPGTKNAMGRRNNAPGGEK